MIHSVEIKEFLVHRNKKVSLSPQVTLIVGKNGSGKTALVQAVIWAIWGKKFRQLTEKSNVTISTAAGTIWRRVGSSELVDYPGAKNSNKTRAAAYLTTQFGDYDVWSRTLHITGSNVRNFTSASPSGKWEHLVRVLDAALFDKVLESLRQDCVRAEDAWSTTDQEMHRQEDAARRAAQVADKLHMDAELVAGGPDMPALLNRLRRIEQDLYRADCVVQDLAKQTHTLEEAYTSSGVTQLLETVTQDLVNLPTETCFVCNQQVPSPVRSGLLETQAAYRKAQAEYREAKASLRESSYRANQTYCTLLGDKQIVQSMIGQAEVALQLFNTQESHYAEVLSSYVQIQLEMRETTAAIEEHKRKLKAFGHARRAAGRAKTLYISQRVKDITLLANQYLAAVGATHTVDLQVTAGERPGLSVIVSGTGAVAYEDCSSGEQRRVDICLLLAMSQVASAYGNLTADTPIIIDEALDTLDTEGVEALLLLACEIGKTRQVLLVSHAAPPLPQGTNIQTVQM